MSWWDTSNFTNLASQALKNAQKTIDKALDISEEDAKKAALAAKTAAASKPKKEKSEDKATAGGGGEFWNSWLTGGQEAHESGDAEPKEEKKEGKEETGESQGSWSLGSWNTWSETDQKKPESEESSSWSSFDITKLGGSSGGARSKHSSKSDTEKGASKRKGKSPKPSLSDSVTSESEIVSVTETCESKEEITQKTETLGSEKSTTVPEKVVRDDDIEKESGTYGDTNVKESDVSGREFEDDKQDDTGVVKNESESIEPVEPSLPLEDEHQDRTTEETKVENSQTESFYDNVTASEILDVHGSADDLPKDDTTIGLSVDTDNVLSIDTDNSHVAGEDISCIWGQSHSDLSMSEKPDMSQNVSLDIPQDDFKEALNVGPSTPVSSEASILTLSSPGQDDLYDSPPSSQQMSGYINISTTQLQSSIDTVYIPHSSSTPSVLSVESDQADTSVLEQEFLDKEQTDPGQSSGNDSSDASKLDSSMDTCTSGETVVDPNQVVRQESGSENEHEHDVEKSDESFPATSPNTSFVKNLLEDAMEDVAKPEDSGSDNHSGGDKSESSKVESEIDKSISGQESSDDIETTTSSDIEVISTPTPNGDRTERPFDLSPLRIALQKTVRNQSHSHRRTDSQSSGSTYSKAGESDQLSPGRDSLERQDLESGDESHDDLRVPDLTAVTEEDLDNPYHPQRLLQGDESPQQHEFIKKLGEQAEILQHRENKLVQLSKENNDLLEANSILRTQLQQVEELRESEVTDINTLTDEFTRRLSESDKKLQSSIKEKEALKKQLQTAQDELKKCASDISQESLLAEKDEQIAELLQEGEKLSKQVLQSNNIIKKLRTKEKENESVLSSQKKKLEEQLTELEHLRKVCEAKDDMEKKQTEAIHQLNGAVQKQEKELQKYRGDHEDHEEKQRTLQVALENAYKEIADLHKQNAAQGSKAQEAALSAEVAVREQLKVEMESEGMRYRQEREALIMQIEDLRLSMARMEKEHNRREDMLRQEISDLQLQLQEDESRTQELTHGVSAATRPLLRQIENLQSNYSAQSASWEKVEKNLTERLVDAQSQLAMAVEKERTSSEKLMDQNVRVTTLESQTARLRQEKSQLLAQAEMDKAKLELLEESKLNEMAQVEAVKNKFSREVTELKKDKVFLETQLEMEGSKLDTEKKKVSMLEEQLKMMERERPRSRGTPSPVSVSRQESFSSFHANPELLPVLPQEDLLERTLMLSSPNGSKMNLYESLRQSGAATLLENLQSQLKQREGEITQLQSEIASLERTRESMAKELVNLTNRNDELEEKALDMPLLEDKYQGLDSRYNALLQMYGEKVEQAEELKLDLQDVKDMYKAQINQLMAN